ncbi:alpha/beta fold hydrolase [Streptomyces litchfieldiae]|uniref:Uncharacterized protein n=1 Tax=Streptomyces litchfieldiae TaxID=3075543 RepID=A0ABU2MKB9_9ACTN|nr:hypothetical protein [Streptomyces sp. DSM 44938]MDT0341818.1 hypothetical protein [Streptomyces sp. DSM 44938]
MHPAPPRGVLRLPLSAPRSAWPVLRNPADRRRAATLVDFRNSDRAPLLLVAGDADHGIPAAVVRENHRRYRRSTAITEYKEYPGRDHLTALHEGWEDVADYALAGASTAAPAPLAP